VGENWFEIRDSVPIYLYPDHFIRPHEVKAAKVTQSPLADNTAGIELTVAWKTMYQ
jgi:hypothetical protein